MQGGQSFEERLRAALAGGVGQVNGVLQGYNPLTDADALNKVYTEQWDIYVDDQSNHDVISALYPKVYIEISANLANEATMNDVVIWVHRDANFNELIAGRELAIQQAALLSNSGSLGDDIADTFAQVGPEGQANLAAQGDNAQRKRHVIIESGKDPRLSELTPQQELDQQQQGRNFDDLDDLDPDPNLDPNVPQQGQPGQPVLPQARQPVVADPLVDLAAEITTLTDKEAGFLKPADLLPSRSELDLKQTIRNRLFDSMKMGEDAKRNFDPDATDPYTKMVNKKVDALYAKYYSGGEFTDKATDKTIVSKLEEDINEMRSKILQQAYMNRGSARPKDVANDGISQKEREAALDAFNSEQGISEAEIKDALAFEYRRDPETSMFDSKAQVVSSLYRGASAPVAALVRAPGAIMDNVSDYMNKNKATTAATAVGAYLTAALFIPGALPLAILVGVPALVIIGIAKAVSEIAKHPVGNIVLKVVGFVAIMPLDALASGLSAGIAAITALCKMANGKSFAENFKDSLPYKPFSASMAIKNHTPGVEPPERKFENAHAGIQTEKDNLDNKIMSLSAPDMAKALTSPDPTISNHLQNNGLMAGVLGDKAVTDLLPPPVLLAKLTEFLDRNPPKDQVKTMLQGNPGLQAVIATTPLATRPLVTSVMQELQPQGQPVAQPLPQPVVQPRTMPQLDPTVVDGLRQQPGHQAGDEQQGHANAQNRRQNNQGQVQL